MATAHSTQSPHPILATSKGNTGSSGSNVGKIKKEKSQADVVEVVTQAGEGTGKRSTEDLRGSSKSAKDNTKLKEKEKEKDVKKSPESTPVVDRDKSPGKHRGPSRKVECY